MTLPVRALVDPVGAVPKAVESRRWFFALAAVSLMTAASGAVLALKLDAARTVIPKLQMTGELMRASEREIAEQIEQAQRVALVVGVAKGLLLMPLIVLLLAVVLKLAGWLIARKVLFVEAFTVAAIAMLPVAIFHGIEIFAALRTTALTPAMMETLVPSSLAAISTPGPQLEGVYKALDLVNVWGALLLGLGFAAASKWKPWKGAAFGLLLYTLFACVFMIALPKMGGGPGGPPGQGRGGPH